MGPRNPEMRTPVPFDSRGVSKVQGFNLRGGLRTAAALFI